MRINLAKAVLLCFGMLFLTNVSMGQETQTKEEKKVAESLNFKMASIDGDEIDLSQYSGKVILIVNVASRCGMTPQYEGLQALYEKYADQGLVVLGFPCNQFGGQEPGSEAEIKEFCSTKYNVSFPMFSKIDVKGDGQADIFKHLSGLDLAPKGAGEVGWNFEKFVIDRSGNPVARFGSRVKPSDAEFVKAITEALKAN